MIPYVLRRLGIAAITFLLASILVFYIIQLPPGDFVDYMIGQMGDVASGGNMVEVMRHQYGLDQPLPVQYGVWVKGIVAGDFGYSFLYKKPVMELIKDEVFWTILITGVSFVIAWLIGIVIGVFSAVRKYTLSDHVFTFFGIVGLSIPPFFLAMVIVYISLASGYGVTGGLFSNAFVNAAWSWAKFADLLGHIWIPILAITLSNITEVMRIMRSGMIEVMTQPYITTAKAKGLKRMQVLLRHGVRTAINPLISMAGLMMPKLLSGIIMTAIVLNLPVMGPTFIAALKSQDMYLAGAYLMLMVIFLIVGNLLADIALAWSDPRIRLEKE